MIEAGYIHKNASHGRANAITPEFNERRGFVFIVLHIDSEDHPNENRASNPTVIRDAISVLDIDVVVSSRVSS